MAPGLLEMPIDICHSERTKNRLFRSCSKLRQKQLLRCARDDIRLSHGILPVWRQVLVLLVEVVLGPSLKDHIEGCLRGAAEVGKAAFADNFADAFFSRLCAQS